MAQARGTLYEAFAVFTVFASLLIMFAASPGYAQVPIDPAILEQIRKANAECFSCHSEQGVLQPPRPGMDLEKLKKTIRAADVFMGSNHGNMDCKQCHGQGSAIYPHAPKMVSEIAPCEQCHAVKVMRVEQQYFASVHAKNLQDKFTCNTCHEVHRDLVAAKLSDPGKIVAQDNHMCLECHNSDLIFATYAPASKIRPDIDRIHTWLPNAKRHWDAVRCVDCHTPVAKTLSHEIVGKDKAERNCVSCHSTSSALTTRLYRHLAATEQEKYGFVNSVLLSNSYVVGATRHPVLDAAMIGLFLATVLGLLGHGAIRVVLAVIRRRKPS